MESMRTLARLVALAATTTAGLTAVAALLAGRDAHHRAQLREAQDALVERLRRELHVELACPSTLDVNSATQTVLLEDDGTLTLADLHYDVSTRSIRLDHYRQLT